MQEYQYLLNSKNYENLPRFRNFIRTYFEKSFSILSHSYVYREFLQQRQTFCFLNINSYTCKIRTVKAIPDIIIENKDAKHYYKKQQGNPSKIK